MNRFTALPAALLALAGTLPLPALAADPAPAAPPPVPLASLPVQAYLGTWYQVAWFPNEFQKQCVSDTTATYGQLPDGRLSVVNRCATAKGDMDRIEGVAEPVGKLVDGALQPARLRVSFLPSWLRWTGLGWADYWVIGRADDLRYAVVSEPTREYLWVLARKPALSVEDMSAVQALLQQQGFDTAKLQPHTHKAH